MRQHLSFREHFRRGNAQADGRAINEKVRLYARVGAALIAARDNKQDAFDAITASSRALGSRI